MHRRALLVLVLGATTLVSGCDSLPDFVPRIDLSGFFGGNHPAVAPAQTLDVLRMQPDLALRFHGVMLKDSDVDTGSNEITLHFAEKANAGMIADVQHAAPHWIAGAQSSGNNATIVASKNVSFSTALTADGFVLVLTPREATGAPKAEAEALRGDLAATEGGIIDGLQREDLRGAFGVDDKVKSLGSGL